MIAKILSRIISILLLGMVFSPLSIFGLNDFGNSSSDIRTLMKVEGGENSANADTQISLTGNFLTTIQSYIIGLMSVVTIGVLLWVGYKLVSAQGNPEEFKKAWMTLIYVAIGLVFIQAAYAIVKVVMNYNI